MKEEKNLNTKKASKRRILTKIKLVLGPTESKGKALIGSKGVV